MRLTRRGRAVLDTAALLGMVAAGYGLLHLTAAIAQRSCGS